MRNSKLLMSAAVAVGTILGIGAASAADLAPRPYTKAPPMAVAAVYNWTGFYVGVNGGGGWGRTDWHFLVVDTFANHDTSGGMAGGQVGYNWQAGTWVFGVEADGDWANIRGSTLCPNPAFVCDSNTRDLASFRGRVGYAAGPVLFYGTGGAGYANTHYSALTPGGVSGPGSTGFFSSDRWGYAAGAGIEWGFAPSWSAKIEYMHYGFDSVTTPAAVLGVNSTVLGLNIDTVKAGVNYHFNWGSPVVARY
jgi:outer membrane immunogenic protein